MSEAKPASPGFFRASAAIAARDLRAEWRTLDTLPSMLLLSLTVLVVFNFAFDLSTVRRVGAERLVPGVLWTMLAFASVVGFVRSFQGERRNETLAALRLAPIDRGALFAGKAAANLAKVTALEIVLIPLAAVFFDFDLPAALPALLLIVPLHTLGLVEIGTLASAVATRLDRGEALAATLLFPFSTPLFISAVKCTSAALAGRPLAESRAWLGLTAGFDLLYLLLALWTFEFVVEE